MNVFEFQAQGNFSLVFGWDTGMNSILGNPISFNEAKRRLLSDGLEDKLPDIPEKGVFDSLWEEGQGSRWAIGYVIADSATEAVEMMAILDNSMFPKKEYVELCEN